MDDMTMSAAQIMMSYGAMGVCTAYFMAKDWFKSKETDGVLKELQESIKEFTAVAALCNRNGGLR